MRRGLAALLVAVLGMGPALAADPDMKDSITLDGDLTQGGLVTGSVPPGSSVMLEDRKLRVAPDGGFVFGFHRDAGPEATLKVEFPDGRIAVRTLDIEQRDYQIERVDGLPSDEVSPPKEIVQRIRRENAKIHKVRQKNSPGDWYETGFIWPATGRISGIYGSQRILNGKPRSPHYGVDIAADAGTPVKAPAGGVVRLADADMYLTGGTVLIDHGHGLTSCYIHMRRLDVTAGQEVGQGDVIGAVGATGRATGPHLHWCLNWFNERLDPQLLVGPMPAGGEGRAGDS